VSLLKKEKKRWTHAHGHRAEELEGHPNQDQVYLRMESTLAGVTLFLLRLYIQEEEEIEEIRF